VPILLAEAHTENEDKQKKEEYMRVFCKVRKTQH
jgi:hypothetical protein